MLKGYRGAEGSMDPDISGEGKQGSQKVCDGVRVHGQGDGQLPQA